MPVGRRLQAALKAGWFYAGWYPKLLWPFARIQNQKSRIHPALAKQLRYASRMSCRLARSLFHAMVCFGPKLERQQLLLGRFVDLGTKLFAITATCCRA